MMERRQIVQQWKSGRPKALVTLVRAEGSSYRRPGAHLIIDAGGEYAGAISGGCLEAEVIRKAAWMVRDGAIVERYSTLFDDTAEIPYGLGCGGVVDLLLEPADTAECRAFISAMEASLTGAESTIATWLPGDGRPLQRAIWNLSGEVGFRSKDLDALDLVALTRSNSTSDANLYIEHLRGPLRLFVLGAGNDVKPVVEMASLLGWRVIVADGRAQLARAERFPNAESVIATASAAELKVTSADAVVIMTHRYEQDRALLISLLHGPAVPGYIGLLGASHRSSLLVSEAAAAIGCSVAECCERVWAPVGLDLGGDGAEAIALAVIAEVQAWAQGRLATARRLTADRVAEQIARGGASRYLQTQCALK
jgi:xanthine dehydrogenase accessory factor